MGYPTTLAAKYFIVYVTKNNSDISFHKLFPQQTQAVLKAYLSRHQTLPFATWPAQAKWEC